MSDAAVTLVISPSTHMHSLRHPYVTVIHRLHGAARGRPARQDGAALLILLTVVLLAFSGMLLSVLGHKRPATAQQATLATLGRAREALLGYAQLHGRLPRPAVSASNGDEQAQACVDEDSCTGFLPWVALAVPGVDAWGVVLRYSVTPAFTEPPLNIGSIEANKTIAGRSGAALQALAGGAHCSKLASCVPAVILSTGPRNFGTMESGQARSNGAVGNDDERSNAVATLVFVQRPYSNAGSAPGGEYDDLLAWLTTDALFRRMAAAGALPDDGRNRTKSFQ